MQPRFYVKLSDNVIAFQVLLTLETNCRELTHLLLNRCSSVVGRKTLPKLSSLPLKHLEFSECYRIDTVDLLELCCESPGVPDLEILKIENFGVVSHELISKLSEGSTGLRVLSLSSVPDISCQSLIAICSHLTELRSLKISWTRGLTDFHLLGLLDDKTYNRSRARKEHQVDGQPIKKAPYCQCDFNKGFQYQKGTFG